MQHLETMYQMRANRYLEAIRNVLIHIEQSQTDAIDAALWAKKRRIPVIAITSRAWAQSVASRHPSGKKLYEVADVVLDDGVPPGDAAVELAGLSYKVGPVSTVSGVALINAVVVQTVDKLLTRGIEPPVIVSANTDGADEINRRSFERFKDRINYW